MIIENIFNNYKVNTIMNRDTPNKKDHLNGLNYLRYGLGIYIVLYHTLHYKSLPDWCNFITGMGFFATSTFFILSGFILTYVYLSNHNTARVSMKESKKSFLIKRLANLYPIHIFSLFFTLLVLILLPIFFHEYTVSTHSIRYVMYDSNNYTPIEKLKHWMDNKELLIAFFMNFTLLQSLNPYYLTFNAPAWSISTLFFMYLLFPFISTKLDKVKNPLKAILIVNLLYLSIPIVFIYFSLYDMPYTGILNRNPLVRLPEFISGILLCNLFIKVKDKGIIFKRKHKIYMTIFIIISLIFSSWLLNNPDIITKTGNASYYLLHDGLLLIPECILVFLFAIIKAKDSQFWTKLGNASLPLFALHIPCYTIFSIIEKSLNNGEISLFYYPLFLILITILCVYFQELLIVPTRKFIINKLIRK